ncbi:hypothetical protein EJ04DRAFT_444386 [Polyplosphaeria fusca]|uniref:Complex I intermediate-associated protein 84 n=1 Tax=Polyplosphaeria fusca TaxID=682080 RepID=A0A9P4QNM8_9PLEO|nr:hypothetical protein EJ04DRAFT_444386 [Polyplosphaeria fusca]
MPSHLTRVVFRTMIANKPLLYRGCLLRPPRPRILPQHGLRAFSHSHRRPFLNFLKLRRKIKDPELPAGLDKLGELSQMQRMSARLPPPSEVATAFKLLFANKSLRVEEFHVRLAANALTYLQHNPRQDSHPWLSPTDLRQAMERLAEPADGGGKTHLDFATMLHDEQARTSRVGDSASSDAVPLQKDDLIPFIRALCLYGATTQARAMARKVFVGPVEPSAYDDNERQLTTVWRAILRGFVREDNIDELDRTFDMLRASSVPFDLLMQHTLVVHAARQNDLQRAKHWYSQPVFRIRKPTRRDTPLGGTHAALLRLCALNGDLSFGQDVVTNLLQKDPKKEAWDAVFLWSAAIGKGVDEVDRMMNVMVRRNDEARKADPAHRLIRPDTGTINDLVEFSMSKQDSYSAERYITLGSKRGILPNARTYTLQMHYRLSVNDIDGARAAYFGLQGEKLEDDQSIEGVNKLVRAMCASRQQSFDDVMAIVDDLHEQKVRLEPETVATLCLLHLQRGEMHDAIDIIQIHAHKFTPQQRALIRERLEQFIVEPQNTTRDVWDTYKILRNLFPETTRPARIKIMNAFFARKRPDMACHVFFHMRNNTHPSLEATKDVYVAAFTGFARNSDAQSLELAHNQLKLDMNVEPDTQIRNALMLAYAATGNNARALELWSEIAGSKEGPTYNSIAIAFRSCEGMPFGDQHAKPIWKRLKEMDIDIDKLIFTAYLGALARNQLDDEVIAMLETVEDEYGFAPDLDMLGNWFNATTNSDRQKNVEAWIKRHYPTVWVDLEGLGHTVTMDGFGYRLYNINRDLDP